MRTISLLSLLLISSITVFAQKVLTIDFDQIKQRIEDPRSPMYYPTLVDRFAKGDSLSADELKHVYYGDAFSDNYDPYSPDLSERFRTLFKDGKYREALPIGLKELAGAPTNIRLTFSIAICYKRLKIEDSTRLFAGRYYSLLSAIRNSGEGTSMENAMVVLRVSDEYDILRESELSVKGQSLIQGEHGPTDRMELSQEDQKTKVEALYFNVTMPMHQMGKMLEGQITVPGSKRKK